MSKVVTATDSTFRKIILESPKATIVDFWAEWCGPCKQIAPILEEISEEMGDVLQVVKINIDEHSAVSSEYGVMSIPTLLVFEKGELVGSLVGAMPKARLVERIKELIN